MTRHLALYRALPARPITAALLALTLTLGQPPGAHAALPGAAAESPHTTHFTIADRWGNVVSLTTTIEATWGSGITVPGYGFLLNNELTDFDFAPTPGANAVAPGKRPRHAPA